MSEPVNTIDIEKIRARRAVLCDRLIKGTLSPEEDRELSEIDEMHDKYVATVHPLPFDLLEKLEALAMETRKAKS